MHPRSAPGPIDDGGLFSGGGIFMQTQGYFESNTRGQPGTAWSITAQSSGAGRSLALALPAGFAEPDAVQALLNGYAAPGTGAVCLDVQYTDANQCGSNTSWPVGYVHTSAVDYH
jgi:hypothetical protein